MTAANDGYDASDAYDSTPRELAARTGWVVVSLKTRLAPEARFPRHPRRRVLLVPVGAGQLRAWGGDPTRVVLAGEGPGANLALSTAMLARDRSARGIATAAAGPLLLITPLAGTALKHAEHEGRTPAACR